MDVQYPVAADDLPRAAVVREWLAGVLDAAGDLRVAATRTCEVAVRFVDAEEGRSLNAAWRGRDYATNVLSFPAAGDELQLPEAGPLPLGDIVLCVPVVRREAEEQSKPLSDHWAHLLVHGMLHLLGYDHRTHRQAVVMERLETRILAAGGVPDPYLSGAPR
ncbi:MAG: rRNA maturation RNase YbeY [Woeseiaceae bacterium]|nr:rRNA maturation RNase YbeY [Woeseiaceae bacterium]